MDMYVYLVFSCLRGYVEWFDVETGEIGWTDDRYDACGNPDWESAISLQQWVLSKVPEKDLVSIHPFLIAPERRNGQICNT